MMRKKPKWRSSYPLRGASTLSRNSIQKKTLCATMGGCAILALRAYGLFADRYNATLQEPILQMPAKSESLSKVTDPSKKLDSICQNIRPCIAIHIFAYRRAIATAELLEKLATSDYSSYGKEIPLIIHLDRPLGQDLHAAAWQENRHVEEVLTNFRWPHGPKLLDFKPHHMGLKKSWLSAWEEPNPNDIMIAMEDDMDVSTLYFQWLLHILAGYNLWNAHDRDPALLGISLSPMLFDEVSARRRYSQRYVLPENQLPLTIPVFLHGAPSSWGGVYFGEPWGKFLSFVELRGAPPFYYSDTNETAAERSDYSLLLPKSLTNKWVRSWKRFLFDYAYGRGAYMMYPNLRSLRGLANSRFLPGEHYNESVDTAMHGCLITNISDLHLDEPLPTYEILPFFDMFGTSMTSTECARRGREFVLAIGRRGGLYEALSNSWQ